MVAAPRCGVHTTLGRPNSGLSVAGSSTNTSKAAPATWPDLSASRSAASSTSPPRAQLMMRTPFFIFLSARGVDDVAGLVGERRVQRDEIGALEQLVELDLLDAEIDRALRRQERIVGDHLHLQAERAVGDDRADIAAADDAERLAEDLDAHELVLLPLAGAGRGVGFRDLPRQRQHQRDGVLGGGDRIAERRVHHDDAARGRRRNVDIVDADAGAADHLQVLGLLQDLRRHLGGGADGEAVDSRRSSSASLSLSLPSVGLEIDLDAAILEDLHGGGRQRVGDENTWGHGLSSIDVGGALSAASGACAERVRRRARRRSWPRRSCRNIAAAGRRACRRR